MQKFKRVIAMLLLVVTVIGFMPVIPGTAATQYPTPSEAHPNILIAGGLNYNFEIASSTDSKKPMGW